METFFRSLVGKEEKDSDFEEKVPVVLLEGPFWFPWVCVTDPRPLGEIRTTQTALLVNCDGEEDGSPTWSPTRHRTQVRSFYIFRYSRDQPFQSPFVDLYCSTRDPLNKSYTSDSTRLSHAHLSTDWCDGVAPGRHKVPHRD